MSISSASSVSLDPILPRSLETSSISSSEHEHSLQYQQYLSSHQQGQKLRHEPSLLSVPEGEDRRASTGSGLTIRPPAAGPGQAAGERKHRDSTTSKRSSGSGRSMASSQRRPSTPPPPLPLPSPGPAPPPKPSSLRSQPSSQRAIIPAFPARPSTAPHLPNQSSASLGSTSTRDRSATTTVLVPAGAPAPPRPGPPTTTPPTQRRRSLTNLPLPARPQQQEQSQSHQSPPPTPPHHAPSFPLRPSAPSAPPLPGRKPLTREPTASSAVSAASSEGGRARGRISSRVFAWATSSSLSSVPAVPAPPLLPPRPGRAEPPPALRRPSAPPTVFSSVHNPPPPPPPPPRHPGPPVAATSPAFPAGLAPGSYGPRGPSPNGPGGAVRAGWGRVQGLWGQGQRRMESFSQTLPLPRTASASQLPTSRPYGLGAGAMDVHLPIMPRPLRPPTGRGGQVFGVRLGEAVRRTRSVAPSTPGREAGPGSEDRTRWLPALVLRCLEHLERWGPEEEGIFRISGMPSHVSTLREEFDRGADYDLRMVGPSDLDPHAVAGVFKAYFRELPEPLLTHYLAKRFDEALLPHTGEDVASPDGLSAFGHASSTPLTTTPQLLLDLAHLVRQLPPENRILLRELSRLLKYLARHRETTRMSLTNLLLVICPSVGIASSLVKLFVEEDDVVFGLPEEQGGGGGAREVQALPSAEMRERELKKKRRETVGSVRTTASNHSYTAPAPSPPANGNGKRDSLPPVIQPPAPSRRNSVQPRMMPSKIPSVVTTGPSPRRRATSVLAQQQAQLLPISGSAPAPVIPAKPETLSLPSAQGGKENRRTPSPPPRLALELPTPLRIPFDRTNSRDAPASSNSPSTPFRRGGFFGELFNKPPLPPKPKGLASGPAGNENGNGKKRDGPPPRVSIMSKLRPGEDWDWGTRVLNDAGVPPVPPLPGGEASASPATSAPPKPPGPAVLRKGTVRDKVRNFEERDGAKTDGEGREPRGMRRFVRTRDKDGLGDGKRGAFFPFN
ncbi:hypothetical protein CALVIDRAFT_257323 [Calocera viscosa TUFC12733]|uniref:Rho-GAP domain-containing protein n=1 Tax=Calocera viscosa (strain TUFC12733) TaxID=1330018 RepID=A0A167JAA7_CALVF|nr:hypothetical protein CALVIDRAFT_257323 [Calocera viscosa TUFC12733]